MTGPAAGREQLVGRAFVALADSLVDDYDVIELLTRLVGYSVELLSADAAGIMLADPAGELRSVAHSSEDAHSTELMQLQAAEGPCMDCYRTARPVVVEDLSDAGGRWPTFVRHATTALLFRSVHAVPLRFRGEAIGALNLFGRRPGALPDDDLELAQALADVATIAILQERALRRSEDLNVQLQVALNSRVVIEQAKGVLGHHTGLDMDQAFNMMRAYARRNNRRLAEVAREIADRSLDPGLVVRPDQPPGKPTG
jgi:GAF domain-containing protein